MCYYNNVKGREVNRMKKQYQVTLYSKSGAYRPVSALVTMEQSTDINLLNDPIRKKEIQTKGIRKICLVRLWDVSDLTKFGYTLCKTRVYDKEQIKKENAERYERIKEEKYASGEWKRPKGK